VENRITNIHKDGRWLDGFYPVIYNDLKRVSLWQV